MQSARVHPSTAEVWRWLAEVPDPEIPVVSVVDLGIVRDVAWEARTPRPCDGDDARVDRRQDLAGRMADGGARSPDATRGDGKDDRQAELECVVTITPTYSGCPATDVIGADIARALRERGIEHVRLRRQLSPAWTTDWLSDAGRRKLQAYGIAPPLPPGARQVACPRCGSARTARISEFGSTPCKALYRCEDCLEPFDHFKCH